MPNFTVTSLPPERIAEAYPLVRMARPELPLGDWVEEAKTRQQKGGVLTLLNPGGTIQALATWEDQPETDALKVETFVVFELSRRGMARQALCDGLQALARERGKTAVQFPLGSKGLLAQAPLDAA
ncbi:hypothetical protein [Sphingomonas arenae]|uniref:hypothetical protein n=1 Tax=Sphingomonas arenae TaxID=2812555 RepID=UPI0019673D79|nr:hypothetical protein [Sphingomonas arenae]